MKVLLKRLIFGSEPLTIEHPIFGKAILIKTESGPYWEAEPELGNETLGVAIETVADAPPSDMQADFYLGIIHDLDSAFAKAAPLLIAEYEKWIGKPFPANWRMAFKFAGMSVPLEGNGNDPWELQFECLTGKQGQLFACCFERGVPCNVSIDT
jgi:hypothetical protein